jgi:Sap-like sulfolipid-1-addressing protein
LSAELISVILLGLGCAANPWGIMIAVLLLDARRGHGIVWTFVVAWIGAITVVLAVLLAGLGAIFESGSDSATTAASSVELVLGLALLAWGSTRLLQARRAASFVRTGDGPPAQETPRWLRAIENISYIGAFLLGIYSATYPLVIAAAGEIRRAGGSTGEIVALAALFVALGSSSVAGVAALGTLAPGRSAVFLDRMRAWLTVHNRAVITAILVVLGVSITARGLSGLA